MVDKYVKFVIRKQVECVCVCELPSGSSQTPTNTRLLKNAQTFGFQKTREQKLASLEAGVGPGLIIEDLTEKTDIRNFCCQFPTEYTKKCKYRGQ
jgi:hypothetical protein